jgi:NodT family efflux transporter outer membrane factor (OMF) lipoprotein
MTHDHPQQHSHLTLSALFAATLLSLTACADLQGIGSQATLRDASSFELPASQNKALTLPAQWWRAYADNQLNRLMDDALASNPSLKIAQARLVRVQTSVMATQAGSGPQLNASLDATRQKFTANGMVPPPLAGSIQETGTAQLSGSWELDFFGKNRAALEAALGNSRAAQADTDAARNLLTSLLARQYFQLARLQAQLGLAQAQLKQRTQILALVQKRLDAGLDTPLELRQSQGTLPDTRLYIETLQEQIDLSKHALAALIGQPNHPLALIEPAQAAITNIAMPSTIHADLLGRRADIAGARWRVEALSHEVAGAKSQFYPNINLVAFAGFSSIGLDRLAGAGSEQWGVGPALRLPLFDGGRLRANLSGKTAELDAAIESYNAAVIDAVRDVADQLSSAQAIARQQSEQQAALAFAENAYAIAKQRQEAGLGNLLNVLAAETAVLNQRRQSIDLTARALDTQIALIRALGGGYQAELPTATAQK